MEIDLKSPTSKNFYVYTGNYTDEDLVNGSLHSQDQDHLLQLSSNRGGESQQAYGMTEPMTQEIDADQLAMQQFMSSDQDRILEEDEDIEDCYSESDEEALNGAAAVYGDHPMQYQHHHPEYGNTLFPAQRAEMMPESAQHQHLLSERALL